MRLWLKRVIIVIVIAGGYWAWHTASLGLETSSLPYWMMLAIDHDDAVRVAEYLNEGVNPNYHSSFRHMDVDTPLKLARSRGDDEIVRMLREAGERE